MTEAIVRNRIADQSDKTRDDIFKVNDRMQYDLNAGLFIKTSALRSQTFIYPPVLTGGHFECHTFRKLMTGLY